MLYVIQVSINLEPSFVYRKLGLEEVKETIVLLQLADRYIKHPRGNIENVLIKVELVFPMDFIGLDIEEDLGILIILGRPFLEINRTSIDMDKCGLILRMKYEQ